MLRLMSSLKLTNIWRAQNADMKKYTWYQRNPIKMARLDYFLISSDIYNRAGIANILPGYRTDHAMISLDVKISYIQRGKGIWKFNNSLLDEEDYSQLVKNA